MGYIKEHCGLFGVYGCEDAVEKVYYGLYSLQHRGEESAGIASTDGKDIICRKGMGLISDALDARMLKFLKNPVAIGHVRYSTFGSSNIENAQPMLVDYYRGKVAIAHNGQLTNAKKLRDEFEGNGSIFHTTSDTEVIVHLMAKPSVSRQSGLPGVLNQLKGAFSLLILTPNEMIGVRDPYGFRPLSLGKLNNGYVFASETCALDQIGAEYVRDVQPGEIVSISKGGLRSEFYSNQKKHAFCIFELVYFSRPDSSVYGESVHLFRKKLGAKLTEESPVDADVVISVPEGGNSAAIGYSHAASIPFDRGFIRNHYVGRTFILPQQDMRHRFVELKLNPLKETVAGKRVIVIDDSIVRGTTSKSRFGLLRKAGAKEIHARISCPPHRHPCYYGIDFQQKGELIAANKTVEETRKFLNVESLSYLSVEGMMSCTTQPRQNFCNACFTSDYPTNVNEEMDNVTDSFSVDEAERLSRCVIK
ncbi:MAG: amidophosphoribosyltransferase [Candidatus Kuenenia stuttgartiensis]|jgi:amidophosphoribosyltransferase|uniref:Amidophosphoribosyltransferase n=1 Tax=Kuenenia stuttgartiensis TaxID=174633 RepID=Q1PUI6_KUEST|nr:MULTISPECIES: amidophosphoribosyltransferase [Kuenenia]MBE7548157.1 amidophosphoribosyltransferase [Planctomycetia bacterium]MBZ0192723.1 amidophosphoribosyltransferase [Candidatus Kuenenia stuttgartiensis]MCF6152618.1 amidophosphoribosyltransferase [Candidatus Kuenenia stuttgartiensis]MCL4726877.1 amidophosphoribosyltransferase [Candidatus Kuenenia stuttgartiensis]MCZ7621164.1 amidophosphoribosyltransferase [Candidatus Kuenenia sp.]